MGNIDTLEAVLNFTTQLTNEKYELEQELASETKNKQQFECDWLECCDRLTDERRIHLELEATLVKKLEAAQAREKVLRDELEGLYEEGDIWNDGVEKTLVQPSDDSALKQLLAAERVRVYEAVDRELEPRVSHAIRGIIKDAVERLGD